jgi:hypothetical protein
MCCECSLFQVAVDLAVLLFEKFHSEILFWVPISLLFGCHFAERQGFVPVFGFGAKAPPRSFFVSGSVPRSAQ